MGSVGGLLWLFLIGAAFLFLMSKAGCGMHGGGGHGHGGAKSSPEPGHYRHERGVEVVQDPVCGMTLSVNRAAGVRTAPGRTFYFCSADCLAKFDREPERYARAAG